MGTVNWVAGSTMVGSGTARTVSTGAVTANRNLFIGRSCSPDPTNSVLINNGLVVNVTDIFSFLSAWFAGDGDFDGQNGTQVADTLAYLAAWFRA